MSTKVSIDDIKVNKEQAPVNFQELASDVKKNAGVRPFVEEPEIVVKKAAKKTVVAILCVIVITLVGIFFTSKKISSTASDLQKKQNQIFINNKQAQISKDFASASKEISPNIEKITNSLPSSSELFGYMGALEKVAQTTGVTQNIKLQAQNAVTAKPSNLPGNNSKNGKGAAIEHTVEVKGSLEQVANYISALEEIPYFLKVTTISLSQSQGEKNPPAGGASATIGIKLFTYN